MATIETIQSLIMIFIMILPGIVLSRKNLLTTEHTDGLSTLVTDLTWPCLVITAMQIPFNQAILKDIGYITVIMLVVFLVAFLISKLLVKTLKMEKKKSYLFVFMILFANTGFIGLPVINALYGKEALFYASIVEMVNDIFIFTVGIMLIQLSAGKSPRADIKGLLSPGMVGVIIGFLLFIFSIELPEILGGPIRIIGDATTPLSMIVIGTQIGRTTLKKLLGDKDAYIMSFIKLIIIPGFVFLIMIVLLKDISLLSKTVIMEFAMPAAACSAIFSQKYKGEVDFAVKGVLISTILSILTLSIFAIILSIMG